MNMTLKPNWVHGREHESLVPGSRVVQKEKKMHTTMTYLNIHGRQSEKIRIKKVHKGQARTHTRMNVPGAVKDQCFHRRREPSLSRSPCLFPFPFSRFPLPVCLLLTVVVQLKSMRC